MAGSALSELRAFDATARLGTMSAAAKALGLRQPTVSAHIASLEDAYRVELFHRRGRRVELTSFGRSLAELTNRIFRAEQDAQALLAGARDHHQGRLTLCAVGPYNLTPLLRRFRARWPTVRVAVSVGDSREIVERVLDYRGDLGVLVHAVNDPRIHCVPLRRQRLMVIAHRAHPLARLQSIHLDDLRDQEFVLREDGSTTRRVFEEGLRQAGVQIRSSLEMGSREAVREAVAQGLGLGVVADTAHVADPRLVALPINGPGLFTHSHVICLAERQRVPLIAGFLELISPTRPPGSR